MRLLVYTLMIVLALATLFLEARLGALGGAAPALGLALVLVSARRAPASRTRLLAFLAGLMAGLGLERGLLLGPIVFVALGALAAGTRTLFQLHHVAAKMVYVLAFALLEAAAFSDFRRPLLSHRLPLEELTAGLFGLTLTAFTYVVLDHWFDRRFVWRHALERP